MSVLFLIQIINVIEPCVSGFIPNVFFESLTMFQDLESSLIAAAVLLSKADHHGSLVEELLDQAKDGDENHHKKERQTLFENHPVEEIHFAVLRFHL